MFCLRNVKFSVIANIIFLDAVVSYSDKLKNRTGNEMTGNHGKYRNNLFFVCFSDSEKFHEMASAAETTPKTCFLLDDDGEFPPVAFAAS